MKHTVTVITPDKEVGQLLRLELSEHGHTVELRHELTSKLPPAPCFFDADAFPDIAVREGDIVFTRKRTAECRYARVLSLPFPLGAAAAMLEASDTKGATLMLTAQSAILYGRAIELTETEHALLGLLIEARGEVVDRDTLVRVMREGTSPNAVTVYIHYLRKKLEATGERIILAARGGGYRIDTRYIADENRNN